MSIFVIVLIRNKLFRQLKSLPCYQYSKFHCNYNTSKFLRELLKNFIRVKLHNIKKLLLKYFQYRISIKKVEIKVDILFTFQS